MDVQRQRMTERLLAHFIVARLRYPPGDPRVEGFISAMARVNAVAERSTGYIWRWADGSAQAVEGHPYQAADADPCLAISMSVWTGPGAFRDFLMKTVHGAFLRRREEWFLPWDGPNYVLWTAGAGVIPTLADGRARLGRLKREGPGTEAFDLGSLASGGWDD
jgi:hypothetical protein